MNIVQIKSELKELIEKETDGSILAAIKILLQKRSLDPALQEKLTARALKAEEDISQGRLINRGQFESQLNEKLGI